MSINFPDSPSQGDSYEFLGVLYHWQTSNGIGYWRITGPGTYSVATGVEIDTGTDDVKYISPKGLRDSKYVTELSGITTLNYSGNGKLATTNTGVSVTGDVLVSDDIVMTGGSPLFTMHDTGTSAPQILMHNDEGGLSLRADAGDVYLYHTTNAGLATDFALRAYGNASGAGAGVALYYDGSQKFITATGGINVTGQTETDTLLVTTSTPTITQLATGGNTVYHYMRNSEGGARLSTNATLFEVEIETGPATNIYENAIQCDDDGYVRLYYDGSQRLTTASDGIAVDNQGSGAAAIELTNSEGGVQLSTDSGDFFIYGTNNGGSVIETYIKGDAGTGNTVLYSSECRWNCW